MNELSLFAGAGGGILGGVLLGWHCIGAVEIAEYPRNILLARQRDGILPEFPIWDDICTFDGTPWRGHVDIISGGFPCQDISSAGKGLGIEKGTRSSLWKQMCRIVREVRPHYVFVENSPLLVSRGLAVVLGDLAEAGYHAAWTVLGAADCGAPHKRDRLWLLAVAYSASIGRHADEVHPATIGGLRQEAPQRQPLSATGSKNHLPGAQDEKPMRRQRQQEHDCQAECLRTRETSHVLWWQSEPALGRVADGVADRVDRLKAIGNGQVPIVAATAFLHLYSILNQTFNQ